MFTSIANKDKELTPDTVAHACNPITKEVKARGPPVQGLKKQNPSMVSPKMSYFVRDKQ
jgi:hypothetical protein